MTLLKNFVKLADTIEVDANFQGAVPDQNTGDINVTYQKVDVNETDGSQVNEGAPAVITLNDTDTAAVMQIFGAAINATEAGTYTQGGAAAPAAAAGNEDAAAGGGN